MQHLHTRQSARTSVPQCGSVQLSIPTSPPTTPPYSLIVYSAYFSTVPIYPLILTGQTASWTVDRPTDVTVVLSIVDSKGNSVGNPAEYDIVKTNGSTACLPTTPEATQTPLSAAINLLTDPQPCSPMVMNIKSGQKPYIVTVVPVGSTAATNITMGLNDDVLSWVNILPPSIPFYVAISDSKGQYTSPERFINADSTGQSNTTTGGADITCPGQETHSFNSSGPSSNTTSTTTTSGGTSSGTSSSTSSSTNGNGQGENGGTGNGQSNGRTAAIVGGVVGVILLLGLLSILFRRKRGYGEKRRGMGFWRRGGHYRPEPDDIPEPMLTNYSGGPMYQTDVSSTPFINPYYVNSSSPPWQPGVDEESMDPASRKAARVARERGVPPGSQSMSHQQQVSQEVPESSSAGGVIELPPAYADVPTH